MRKQHNLLVAILLAISLMFTVVAEADTPAPKLDKATFAQELQEARLASLGAATCAGTYVPGGKATEYSYLAEYGFKVTPYSQKINGVEVNFMVAVNPTPYKGKRITVVAFRGSQSKDDWKLDLTTGQTPFAGQGPFAKAEVAIPKDQEDDASIPQVHKGFNAYTLATLQCKVDIDGDGVADNIPETLLKEPDLTVVLTGHSLGGAVATLYGEYLIEAGVPKERIPIVTFGAPAVGNAAFADTYGDKVYLLRFANSHDPVPISLQSVFGGYKQFGKFTKYDLSGKYTDNQHAISYYCDLAVRNYFLTEDKGIAAGYLSPLPMTQTTGTEPLVAVAFTAMNHEPDLRYAPDIKRFALEEYVSMLPRYVVIESNLDKNEEAKGFTNLMAEAKAVGANYLLTIEVDRHRVAQTNKWFVGINQGIFAVPSGNMLAIDAHNTRVTFQQGIIQSTIAMVEECKKTVKEKLPFVRQNQALTLREVL